MEAQIIQMKTDRNDRPRRFSRVSTSSASSSRHSSNDYRTPQDNVRHTLQSSREERRHRRKRKSGSNSATSHSRRRNRKSNKSTPTRTDSGSSRAGSFSKWVVTVVIFIAVADLIVLWTSIDATIGDQNGDKPHQIGPEMGLQQLTDNNQSNNVKLQLINDIVKKQQEMAKLQNPNKGRYSQSDLQRLRNQSIRDYRPIEKVKNVSKFNRVENSNTFGVDEHIVNILTAANIQLDEELAHQLPKWEDIVSMYGDKPIIYGLDTCQEYRDTFKPEDRMLGPAGIFNTGTNLLFELMKANCNIKEARNSKTHREPKRNGMRFQPPWGKHNPPSEYRDKHVAAYWGEGINQKAFFPVVMVKDFYHWAGSQCRHSYTTFWYHSEDRCPNLVNEYNTPTRTRVRFGKGTLYYESILDLWNKYYQEWGEQSFPHLTTRYEDLLFHGEEVTRLACQCVGGEFTTNFGYVEGSAKENGLPINDGAYGLIKALLQYGSSANRLSGFTDRDRLYASKTLDSGLIQKFGYTPPPLPK